MLKYFIFDDELDKQTKLDKLYDFSSETKAMYNSLKITNNVAISDFGEPHWDTNDELKTINNVGMIFINSHSHKITKVSDHYFADESTE